MDPRVSVVIPCFNAEAFVGATLESVLAQTFSNLEIIVVDDGSTDASAELVQSYEGRGVTLVRQENRGQTAALNAGLKRASGDFVQYLDADDLLDPEKIEVQLDRLSENPGCVASACWGRFYDRPEHTRFETETVSQDLSAVDWLVASRTSGLGMMFPALWLIPMNIIRAVGPWRVDLTLNNDAEYFTRILLNADRVLYCSAARCRYRSGLSASLSGKKSPSHWASQFSVLELCESYVREREDSERVRRGFCLSWQQLAHASYPYDREIAERAMIRARGLHPATIRPGGGIRFKVLSRLIGWRAARRLQVASGRP